MDDELTCLSVVVATVDTHLIASLKATDGGDGYREAGRAFARLGEPFFRVFHIVEAAIAISANKVLAQCLDPEAESDDVPGDQTLV